MELIKWIKEHKAIALMLMLIVGIGGTNVLAQLMSNQVQQQITVRGIDGSVTLSIETALPSEGWAGEGILAELKVEKMRNVASYLYFQVASLTGDFAPTDIQLDVQRYDVGFNPIGEEFTPTMTVVNSSCVQYRADTWMNGAEMVSYRGYVLTWLESLPTGDYIVLIFAELT